MQEPVSPIQITLPVRQLVEFLRRVGSIDNRFAGFDRANEGARIHRKLQRAAVKEHADYAAEVFLRGIFAYEEIEFTPVWKACKTVRPDNPDRSPSY